MRGRSVRGVSARTIERSAEAAGAAARSVAAAEAAAIRARDVLPLPPQQPVPDMLYVEVDGTGVPVRASETEGRAGKADDGKAGTREVKLAATFSPHRDDSDVSRFGRGSLTLADCAPELAEMISAYADVSALSGGTSPPGPATGPTRPGT